MVAPSAHGRPAPPHPGPPLAGSSARSARGTRAGLPAAATPAAPPLRVPAQDHGGLAEVGDGEGGVNKAQEADLAGGQGGRQGVMDMGPGASVAVAEDAIPDAGSRLAQRATAVGSAPLRRSAAACHPSAAILARPHTRMALAEKWPMSAYSASAPVTASSTEPRPFHASPARPCGRQGVARGVVVGSEVSV